MPPFAQWNCVAAALLILMRRPLCTHDARFAYVDVMIKLCAVSARRDVEVEPHSASEHVCALIYIYDRGGVAGGTLHGIWFRSAIEFQCLHCRNIASTIVYSNMMDGLQTTYGHFNWP